MARIPITKPDGSKSPYFWSDDESAGNLKTIFKKTPNGVTRMKGARFDVEKGRVLRGA